MIRGMPGRHSPQSKKCIGFAETMPAIRLAYACSGTAKQHIPNSVAQFQATLFELGDGPPFGAG